VFGPAMPSATSPRRLWKRLRAAAVSPAKRPSTRAAARPKRRSRNSSTATSHPTVPIDSSREPSSGRPRVPSARRVIASSFPEARSPCRFWNETSALVVCGPRSPSTGPGFSPCARRPTWSAAMLGLAASPLGEKARTQRTNAPPQTAKRRTRNDSPRPPGLLRREEASSAAGRILRLPSPVAQLAEHPAVNRRVVGSSPTWGVTKAPLRRGFLVFEVAESGDFLPNVLPRGIRRTGGQGGAERTGG
jgi:hypothetical protein